MKFKGRKTLKGYMFSALAALTISNIYLFSKIALLETPLYTFGFYWFLMAFLYNGLAVSARGRMRLIAGFTRSTLKTLAIIGIFETLSAIAFFASIQAIENPSVASFIITATPVFVALISVPLLNERFGKAELAGMVITLAGTFMLSYSGTFSLEDMFVKGSNLAVLSCMFGALGMVIAKKNIKSIDPFILSLNRVVFILVFYAAAMCVTRSSFAVTLRSFAFISAGALCGPFLAAILQYRAYRLIDVSKASLVQNTHGVFVLISTFIYFGILPLHSQVIGGFVAIAGVAVMVLGSRLLGRR